METIQENPKRNKRIRLSFQRFFMLMAAIIVASMTFVACDKADEPDPVGPGEEPGKPGEIAVTSVTINQPASGVELTAGGGTITLSVTIEPANATDKTVTWKSSNTAIATVSSAGVVTGVREGTVTITATTNSGNKSADFNITVKPAANTGGTNELTNAMINTGNATIAAGTYLVKSDLTLNSGNNLTFSQGVILRFDANRRLNVQNNAKIIANGSSSQPITFTSSNASPSAGDWYGIYISQSGSEFSWCVFEYGAGAGSGYGMLYLDDSKASFTNCTFRNAKFSGIYLYRAGSGFTTFNNNTISNCGEAQDNSYPILVNANLSCLGDMGVNTITSNKGIGVAGGTIPQNVTIKSYVDYLFYGDQTLNNAAVMNIEPGATLKFETAIQINVNAGARIIADGTASNPITFTSAKTTNKGAGDWFGIYINSTNNSDFNYCIFEYGAGSGSGYGMIYLNDSKASFTNCIFRNSRYSGIYLYRGNSGLITFDKNTIVDCGETDANSYPILVNANLSCLGDMGNNSITTSKGIGVALGTIPRNTTIKSYVEYLFYGDQTLNNAAELTIEPGSVLKFNSNIQINVNAGAKIIANGTASNPITFTSSKSSNKGAGDWYGIYLNSNNSVFNYCTFEYGAGSGSGYGMLYIDDCKAGFTNCTFRNSRYSGIYLYHANSGFTTFDNNKISDCGETDANSYPILVNASPLTLSAMGANNTITSAKGIGLTTGTINGDLTLRKYLYTVNADVTISQSGAGATLTVSPGAKLMFTQGRQIVVGTGGKLVAQGTSSDRIIFTGTTLNKGWWNGIRFNNNNALSGSILNYCEISYGGRGTGTDNNGNISCYGIGSGILTVRNCTITNSRSWGIFVYTNAHPTIENNNSYSNNGPNNNSNNGSAVIGAY